jgi:hypothetical protein
MSASKGEHMTLQEFIVTWWIWLIIAIVLAGSAAFSGMFALASGTAFGTHYHTFTPRQRWMSRLSFYAAVLTCLATSVTAFLSAAYCAYLLLR